MWRALRDDPADLAQTIPQHERVLKTWERKHERWRHVGVLAMDDSFNIFDKGFFSCHKVLSLALDDLASLYV